MKYAKGLMKRELGTKKLDIIDHQLGHAYSTYYFSPFYKKKCIVFTIDGSGDGRDFSSLFLFNGKKHNEIARSHYPVGHYNYSIGALYATFTEILGFRRNSDEGKTEALAAFGNPDKQATKMLQNAITINVKKLIFETNLEYADYLDKKNLAKLMKKIGRENFAATIQKFLEERVVTYLNLIHSKYKINTIAMAGGVVANVILNLNIYEKTPFKEMYIFPAMGDEGVAAGAAISKALELGEDISWINKKIMPY